MDFDPFRLCLAFGPVAVYLALLGIVNLAKRPLIVSGGRDVAALALGVSGMVIVGPLELFFPENAAAKIGPAVWVILITIYVLSIVFMTLIARPRLIIYNISIDQLRPALGRLIERLDPSARWAGDCVVLPGLGIQFYIDNVAPMRNITLKAAGPNQNFLGWRKLELELTEEVREIPTAFKPGGIGLVSVAGIILVGLVIAIAYDPQATAESLFKLLRL